MLVIVVKLKFAFELAGTLQSPHHANSAFSYTELERLYGGSCLYTHWPLLLSTSQRIPCTFCQIWLKCRKGQAMPEPKVQNFISIASTTRSFQLTVRGLLQIAVLTMLAIHGSLSFLGRRHPKLRKLRSPFP